MALAPEEVGKRIAQARKDKNWTHQAFLDAVRESIDPRTNLRTVQRWQIGRDPKSGKSWLPRLHTLMELADLMDKPRSYFVEDEYETSDEPATRGEVAELRSETQQVREKVDRILEILDPPDAVPDAQATGREP